MKIRLPWFLLLCGASLQAAPFTNGGFEAGIEGWRFWTRDKDAGAIVLDNQVRHGGNQAAQIQHRGEKDWSLEPGERLTVQPGDLFEMEVWVRTEGEGRVRFCASTWNRANQAVEWSHSGRRQAVAQLVLGHRLGHIGPFLRAP